MLWNHLVAATMRRVVGIERTDCGGSENGSDGFFVGGLDDIWRITIASAAMSSALSNKARRELHLGPTAYEPDL